MKFSSQQIVQMILIDITRLLEPKRKTSVDSIIAELTQLMTANVNMSAQQMRITFQALYYAAKRVRDDEHMGKIPQNSITNLIFKFFDIINCIEEPYIDLVLKGIIFCKINVQCLHRKHLYTLGRID